jgi:hypothetical protein
MGGFYARACSKVAVIAMRLPSCHRPLGCLAVLLALYGSPICSAESAWTLAKQSEGISVYTRSVADSPLKEFRGDVELAASVEQVLAVLRDASTFPDWLPDTLDCRLLRTSDVERTIYIETHAPWPVWNRDGVFHFTFSRDPGLDGAANVRVEAIPGLVPPREGKVRVPRSDGFWRIEPKAGGVHVSYQIHADPGGWVPVWLANITVVRMPFKTLKNLRRQVQSPPRGGIGCPGLDPAQAPITIRE